MRVFASPYPGMISTEVSCPEQFPPIEIKNNSSMMKWGFLLPTNSRKLMGVCESKEIIFESLFAVQYCEKNHKMYEIRYFLKGREQAEVLQNIFQGFECQ
jgi:hypothetical protein